MMVHKTIKNIALIALMAIPFSSVQAQDDLESLLGEDNSTEVVTATFKSTRVVNGQSVEMLAPGALDFRISHRFGTTGEGPKDFWGLDQATIRLALEYGVNDWLNVGLGRSSFNKIVDGFAKVSLAKQTRGKNAFPVSIVYFSNVMINTSEKDDIVALDSNGNPSTSEYPFDGRLSFANQLLIAKKFNSKFSAQLTPSIVHRNLVELEVDMNTFYALGTGVRYKISPRVSINLEYFMRLESGDSDTAPNFQEFHDAFAVGFDIETGGHVFQLHLTNASQMNELGYITQTTDDFFDNGVRFGFNISREFTLKEKHKNKKKW